MKKDIQLLLYCIWAMLIIYSGISSALAEEENADALKNQGIGPIKNLELKPLDTQLAAKGKDLFATKCSACHKIGSRYVGPDLAGVAKRRAPEWIMNMILNPQEMIQKDPLAQGLFEEFLVPMTFQNVAQEEARAILEYLREESK